MKFSETWLRTLVNPAITTQELVAQLTMAGLEVDAVEPASAVFSGVVVGEVVEKNAHPDADKLSVCQISNGQESVQVVCGAANVRVGMKVPFAQIGAVLPGDFKIKKAKLRQVESFGMLCAAEELGLAEKSDGLLELPADAPLGVSVRDYLLLDDTIIEVDLTPNRGDCLSLRGIARETAVNNKISFVVNQADAVPSVIDAALAIDVSEPSACPVYLSRVIKGVDVSAQTPVWLKERLRRAGVRSIDPVVDVTNYVLQELGQPLHAFDLSKIKQGIVVRFAKQAEKITLLDGNEITLADDTLVIADDSGAIALAGIMGGSSTCVDSQTKDIVLECAFFSPISIAGKARKYGLHTDSSHRFERGVDFQLQIEAIERATQLIVELCGGEPAQVVSKISECDLPALEPIIFKVSSVKSMLGMALTAAQTTEIFTLLGMSVQEKDTDTLSVTPPSFRFDIRIAQDLIEEVARIYGYNNLPVTQPKMSVELPALTELTTRLPLLRSALIQRDYQEVITYSFIDPKMHAALFADLPAMTLLNPISTDLSVMRTSLVAGLIKTLIHNANRQHSRVRLFESGQVFEKQADGSAKAITNIAGLIWGGRHANNWCDATGQVDFYDIKGDVESLLSVAGDADRYQFVKSAQTILHPGKSADIVIDNQVVGFIGQLHPSIAKQVDVSGEVYLFELPLDVVMQSKLPKFSPVSKFPAVARDFAFLLSDRVTFGEIESVVLSVAGEFVVDFNVFDVYKGKGIPEKYKSIAFNVTWQHSERTLAEDEISGWMQQIISTITDKLSAELRG